MSSRRTKPPFGARAAAAAYTQEANEKAALFRILGELADDNDLPELIGRLDGKDPVARMHIINILSRFTEAGGLSARCSSSCKDTNKLIRAAALARWRAWTARSTSSSVCELLRDPEIDVQNKAIDVVIRANDPDTIKYLIAVLKDENEYARRAAVEVLNEIGNAKSVKHLLEAVKDDDWWVRSRAADALGKIGGPKVVEAVLQLVGDKDEDIRRAAIEILNQTKDERAVGHLIEATKDKDWWVSERAVDALAEIGSKRAVPRLHRNARVPRRRARCRWWCARWAGSATTRSSTPCCPCCTRAEKEIRARGDQRRWRKLADERRLEHIRVQIQAQTANTEQTVAQAALRALSELDSRFSAAAPTVVDAESLDFQPAVAGIARGATQAPALTQSAAPPPRRRRARAGGSAAGTQPSQQARTLLMSEQEVQRRQGSREHGGPQKLDITTLKPGDIIEGRYKYIEKIGKGAFGTVLLMEDTVVDERLILKFLNPNVSEDEEMMKRFVHELRYSRKITHHNVIRIYDFLYIQGNYAISMEYFPSHTLGSEIVNEKPMPLTARARVRHRHLHRHGRSRTRWASCIAT